MELLTRVGAALNGRSAAPGRVAVQLTRVDTPEDLISDGPFDCLVLLLSGDRAPCSRVLASLPVTMPVVVVAPDPQDAAMLLRRHQIYDFVSTHRLELELDSTLRRAYASTSIGKAVALVRGLDGMSCTLRSWLLRCLATTPPYVSVSASAEKPTSVRKEWQRKIGRSKPKAFLRWVILVRAAELMEGAGTRARVARSLEVSVGVLDRAAAHHLERRLDPGSPGLGAEIHRGFETYLVRTFVGTDR